MKFYRKKTNDREIQLQEVAAIMGFTRQKDVIAHAMEVAYTPMIGSLRSPATFLLDVEKNYRDEIIELQKAKSLDGEMQLYFRRAFAYGVKWVSEGRYLKEKRIFEFALSHFELGEFENVINGIFERWGTVYKYPQVYELFGTMIRENPWKKVATVGETVAFLKAVENLYMREYLLGE